MLRFVWVEKRKFPHGYGQPPDFVKQNYANITLLEAFTLVIVTGITAIFK